MPHLRVLGLRINGFKTCMYAVQAGIFTKYGVNVEPSFINSGVAASAALIGGSTDIAFVNTVTTISARAKSVPVQIVAPGPVIAAQSAGVNQVLVLKDGPIRAAQDLNDKFVGTIGLADLGSVGTQAWIDKNGGNSKTIKFVEITPVTGVQMLEEGRISAAVITEPLASQATAGGKVRALAYPLTAIAPTFLNAGYLVMTAAAQQQADAMHRFSDAMHEAAVYMNNHKRETFELEASYTSTTPDAVARSIRSFDPDYVEAAQIQPVVDALAKYGIIDAAFPAATLISPYAARRGR